MKMGSDISDASMVINVSCKDPKKTQEEIERTLVRINETASLYWYIITGSTWKGTFDPNDPGEETYYIKKKRRSLWQRFVNWVNRK